MPTNPEPIAVCIAPSRGNAPGTPKDEELARRTPFKKMLNSSASASYTLAT